jgi:hypothetical protein
MKLSLIYFDEQYLNKVKLKIKYWLVQPRRSFDEQNRIELNHLLPHLKKEYLRNS